MADLVEVPQWDAGIYQIEQTDPVLGGPPNLGNDQGITNVPAQQLANRTVYLLDFATTLETAVAALEAILLSGGFTDNIEVSGISPSILLTETDQGAVTNQAHLTLSGGVLFMQAESGIISLTGLANTNLTSLTAKFEGVYQEVLHNGMMATQVQAEDGVTGGVWMDDIRVNQAIDAQAGLTEGTKQATVSGTAFDFTGIPAGTKEILVIFDQVSLTGTDHFLIQLGDAGGLEISGYVSGSSGDASLITSTSGMVVRVNLEAGKTIGVVPFYLMDAATNLWVQSHGLTRMSSYGLTGGGSKALSAELTQLRLTSTGASTFDSGSVNILYR